MVEALYLFIEAANLVGNGMQISANGFSGGNALGDVASGGGPVVQS